MTDSATGIILRTRPLTETSLIVHWLTPGLGRIGTAARGARLTKSPFAGKLDLFFIANFSFQRSRNSNLHYLREVSLIETHGAIRHDLLKLQQAAYAAAFIEFMTETESPLPEIFELARGFLKLLCEQMPRPQNIFALELKLLCELGLGPDFAETRLTPGSKKIIQAMTAGDWNSGSRLKLSPEQCSELGQFLHGFLIYHLGRLPSGRTAALASGC